MGKSAKNNGQFQKQCGAKIHRKEWPNQYLKKIKGEQVKIKKSTIEELKKRGIIDDTVRQICNKCLSEAGFEMDPKNDSEPIKQVDVVMDDLPEFDMAHKATQTDDDYYSFENRFKRIGNLVL